MRAILKFDDGKSASAFLANKPLWERWFKWFKFGNIYDIRFERLARPKIMGQDNFIVVSNKFGKTVEASICNWDRLDENTSDPECVDEEEKEEDEDEDGVSNTWMGNDDDREDVEIPRELHNDGEKPSNPSDDINPPSVDSVASVEGNSNSDLERHEDKSSHIGTPT
ncbi:hypothetical protein L1887_15835 [Cichorium endivia]|nr:hypothetical protein L1887_15835 [Cichorium endivia]